jgi:hypothetical protein
MKNGSSKSKASKELARTQEEFAELKAENARAQAQFLTTELNLASTFCDIAWSAKEPERRKKSAQNARTAYEAALRFLRGKNLPEEEMAGIMEQLRQVEQNLACLDQ